MAGENRTRVGNVEIVALSDASFPAEPSFIFPEKKPQDFEPYRQSFDQGDRFTVNVGCFAVRTSGKTAIIDTGIGPEGQAFIPAGRLLDAMKDEGVSPAEVDLVILTHLHLDHVGWNTLKRGDRYVPTFPKARYVTTAEEWAHWTQPDVAANTPYFPTSLQPLEAAGVLDLVSLNAEHRVTDELTLLATPGHTPGHISVGIASAGEFAVVLGDVAHHPLQIGESGWRNVFDMNPALSGESREKLFERIERERALVAAGHFLPPNFGRIVRVNGRRSWRAL